jgi:hypothetical protein
MSLNDIEPYISIINLLDYYQHASNIDVPVGNSDIPMKDFSYLRFPAQVIRYTYLFIGWMDYGPANLTFENLFS